MLMVCHSCIKLRRDEEGYSTAHSPAVAEVAALVATGAASETRDKQIITWVHSCKAAELDCDSL